MGVMESYTGPELACPFESVRSLLERYKDRHPDKRAIYDLDQDSEITYAELHDRANRIARFLASRGVGPGDRVAIIADEIIEKLICWMGIWRLGAVVAAPNVELNVNNLAHILGNMDPTFVLYHRDYDDPSLRAGLDCEALAFSTWQDPAPEEFFAAVMATPPTPEVESENTGDGIAAMFCTSGTTDMPKVVLFDHFAYWLAGLSTLDFLGLEGDDRTLEYRSFGWNSAQILSLMPWLQTGLSMHIAKRFSQSRFFDWIKDNEITFAAGVPTVVNMLLNEPMGVTAEDVPSLRLMTCSTAPLSGEQWDKFEAMYGVTLLQLYGMSEAGWICGNRHYRRRIGTVGPPAKHQEFLIVDPDGNPVAQGEEGEVTIGGPQTTCGLIAPDGTFEDLTTARIPTGDLAVMDADGFVQVTGRTKDIIIRGGVNIAPVEIENFVMTHPDVLEAAAVGVPDEIYGEEVVCFVVAKDGETLNEATLSAHCGAGLPAFKVPRGFRLVDDLPRSDRGKVRRDTLKDLWENKA